MSKKLLASAPTKQELETMINEYFCCKTRDWTITESGAVFNKATEKTIDDWSVCVKKGRWRLEWTGGQS